MTIASGKIKWHNWMTTTGPTRHQHMVDQWVAALTAEGAPPGPEAIRRYRDGLRGRSAEVSNVDRFLGKSARDSDRWERNTLRGIAR